MQQIQQIRALRARMRFRKVSLNEPQSCEKSVLLPKHRGDVHKIGELFYAEKRNIACICKDPGHLAGILFLFLILETMGGTAEKDRAAKRGGLDCRALLL